MPRHKPVEAPHFSEGSVTQAGSQFCGDVDMGNVEECKRAWSGAPGVTRFDQV